MYHYILLFLILVSSSFFPTRAQLIKGKVFDATNKVGLPGAVVLDLSDSSTSITNLEGVFQYEVTQLPVRLKVLYVGYDPLEFTLQTFKPFLNIGLKASEQHLNEVVVQATRFNQKLMDIPASVNAITEIELLKNNETVLVPAINRLPGVYMQSGAYNTNRLAIRGIGARTPYSTNRVRAYFNDIPLTSGEGESTIEDIDLNALQRVEVIKGPASSIYGAGLGGTINLISDAPEYASSNAKAKYMAGSFGLSTTSASLAYSFNEGYINLNFNDLHTDGYRENSIYDRQSVTINTSIYNDEEVNISFLGSFIDLKSFIPSSIDRQTFEETPQAAADNWAAAEGFEDYIKSLAGLSVKYEIHDQLSHHSSIFFSFRDAEEPRPFDILLENTLAAGIRSRLEYKSNNGLHAQIGGEFFNDWYAWSTYENLYRSNPGNGSVLGSQISNSKERRKYYNLFLQLKWAFSERMNLEGGINLNETTYTIDDLFTDDLVDQTGAYAYAPILSPRISLLYKIKENWNAYATVSHGYSIPSLAETLTPEGLINPAIEPEKGINYEIGTKGHWLNKRLSGEVALYRTYIKDLLVAERVGPDQYVGVNAGRSIHSGLEILLRYQLVGNSIYHINPFVSLTLADYTFDEFINRDINFAGKEISGFPSEMITAGFDLSVKNRFYFFGEYNYVGQMPMNDLNTLYTDNYSVVNIKSGYKASLMNDLIFDVSAGVNNLLDTSYASMILVNAVGFGTSDPRYYYPGLPRNYYFGASLSYQF